MIEALNYRCLRYIKQDLGSFHVLVGPNASGKTTFFDVIRFLGDLVERDLDYAIRSRTENLQDLTWGRVGDRFELALEVGIPEEDRSLLVEAYDRCRYEVAVGVDSDTKENAILAERVLLLKRPSKPKTLQRTLFPEPSPDVPRTIMTSIPSKGIKTIVNKVPGGNDNYYSERGKGWDPTFKLGPRKSALANLPEDESKFPVSTRLKRMLVEGVQSLVLNSMFMRNPSSPGKRRGFQVDGSNLPWVVQELHDTSLRLKRDWVAHLQTALPELDDILTFQRDEDRHRYLMVQYAGGLIVPSWVVSDGTLRLLALTLLAYVPKVNGIFLIEEPENGIHPRAVETVFQSLSSVYNAQILLATHSPVILGLAKPADILCFAKSSSGATDVIRGIDHPALRDWQGETNLGTLYAAGVLG